MAKLQVKVKVGENGMTATTVVPLAEAWNAEDGRAWVTILRLSAFVITHAPCS